MYTLQHKRNEQNDRRKSAVITFVFSLLVFLGIFFYQFTRTVIPPQEITTMLINFGDLRDGDGTEEPAPQEGSFASSDKMTQPQPVAITSPAVNEKVITGNNISMTTPKTEKKENVKKAAPQPVVRNKPSSASVKSSTTTPKSQGDGKGTAAVGNLIRGRGNNAGSQGTSGTTGNAGDPLGADGNGDTRIGIDRKLVGFIPGTMGRGGSQPSHNCEASGSITIAYVVDQAGNVTSARRSGGISDACVVSTTVAWVRQYVKAEKANTSSTGSYRITF